jgi:hypothetical protein
VAALTKQRRYGPQPIESRPFETSASAVVFCLFLKHKLRSVCFAPRGPLYPHDTVRPSVDHRYHESLGRSERLQPKNRLIAPLTSKLPMHVTYMHAFYRYIWSLVQIDFSIALDHVSSSLSGDYLRYGIMLLTK